MADPPSAGGVALPTAMDVVQALDRDAQDVAKQEDDEATVAEAVASQGQKHAMAQDQNDQDRKKPRTEEPEAAPAEAAQEPAPAETEEPEAAAASTRGPLRRRVMKSRIVVSKKDGSEKYSLVLSAKETVAEIDRILEARDCALKDEAWELFGASTPDEAFRALLAHGRICQASDNALHYLVLDFELQKRSRYYVFTEWAATPEGDKYLWKQDRRTGWWSRLSCESEAGRFVIPRDAKGVFKTYCDYAFGGQVWFDVLNQMGGCPVEFVDAWNAVINQRLEAARISAIEFVTTMEAELLRLAKNGTDNKFKGDV